MNYFYYHNSYFHRCHYYSYYGHYLLLGIRSANKQFTII